MKTCRTILLVMMIVPTAVVAQKYWSENEVALTLKEKDKGRVWFSDKMETYINLERNEMSLRVDAITFKSANDSLRNLDILDEQTCPTIYFELILPFNKIDKSISGRQSLTIPGNLLSCGKSTPVNIAAFFEFSEKLLVLSFSVQVEASTIGVIVPKGMDNMVRLTTDNGKVLIRM